MTNFKNQVLVSVMEAQSTTKEKTKRSRRYRIMWKSRPEKGEVKMVVDKTGTKIAPKANNFSSKKSVASVNEKKVVLKKEVPKKEVPKKEGPKKEGPKKEVLKIVAPKKEAPKREVPKKVAPKQEVQKKKGPKKEVLEKVAPKKEAPRKEVPKKEVPKKEVQKKEVQKKKGQKEKVSRVWVPKKDVQKKEPTSKSFSKAQIREIRNARRAQRQAEQDQKWRRLCSAHSQLMSRAPQARCSTMETKVYKAVFSQTIRYLGDGTPEYFRLSADNFGRPLELLLRAEEAWEHTEMRNYDLQNVLVTARGRIRGKIQYQFRTNIMNNAGLKIIPSDSVILFDGSQAFELVIDDIDGELVFCSFRLKSGLLSSHKSKFTVSFVQSGISTNRFLSAVQQVDEEKRFKNALYGEVAKVCRVKAKIDFCSTGSKELDIRFANLNSPQKKAIINIMEARCRPNLYVLFGPPGTGKTFTLVETVVQIYQRNPSSRLLVCSSSNTCVDGLAANIFETRQVKSMKRLCSKHHFNKLVNRPSYISLEPREVKSSRVVVATNVIAAKITSDFDYVLVDEAGHSHVPETLIPLTKLRPDGCFVLAGDPRQLGPVIKSFEVERLGLGASLLERMCDLKTYARVEGKYNERYITKLIKSYRCDPRILGLCNNLFYHGDLECLGKTPPSVLRMIGAKKPLLFTRVYGVESCRSHSHSRCNKPEAFLCIKLLLNLYKMGFESKQIGIITPYNLQKDMLTQEMHKQLKKEAPLLNQRFKMPSGENDNSRAKTAETALRGFQLPAARSLNVEELHRNDVDLVTDALRMLRLQAEMGQKKLKEEKNKKKANEESLKIDWFCKIDTVDAFQGSEREVIIVSTVRTPDQFGAIEQCGFLADAKRFNVTISRAKWLVFVVGHPAVLECCKFWEEFDGESDRFGVKG